MKKKRVERVERRRRLAEPNLAGEAKTRAIVARKGIAAAIRKAFKGQR